MGRLGRESAKVTGGDKVKLSSDNMLILMTKQAGDDRNWFHKLQRTLGDWTMPGLSGSIDLQDADTNRQLESSNTQMEKLIADKKAELAGIIGDTPDNPGVPTNTTNTTKQPPPNSFGIDERKVHKIRKLLSDQGGAAVAGGGLTGLTLGALVGGPDNRLTGGLLGAGIGVGGSALARHFLLKNKV